MQPSAVRRVPRSLALTVAVAGLAWWFGAQAESPRQKAAEARGPRPSAITAPVEQRRLRETITLRGTVRTGGELKVQVDPPGGDRKPLVTKLPVRTGDRVRAGTLLIEVAGRPLFVLPGRIPMYRDLAPGDRGDDVAQLQRALAAVGHPYGDRTGTFGAGTAAAVKRFYAARGYVPATEAPAGGADRGKPGSAVVKADEIVFAPVLPATVSKVSAAMRARVEGELMRLSSGSLRISAPIQGDAEGIRTGMSAELQVDGRTYAAEVTAVRPGGGGEGAGEQEEVALLTPSRRLPAGALGRDIAVRILVMDTRTPVTAVPSAAVWTRADGSTYVVAERAGRPAEVQVETGRSADGYIELRDAAGLRTGDEVRLAPEPNA